MKKNYIGILAIITLGLGAVIFLTVQKLQQTTPVAPTVPQVTPKASAPACTLTFALAATPTPTPTPGSTPTPTPTPAPSCNSSCTTNADCQSGMICFDTGNGKACRNPSCTSQTNCACVTPTPTPTVTPTPTPTPTPAPTPASCNSSCTTSADCQSGMACINNVCRNPSCSTSPNCVCQTPTPGPTPTPTTPPTPQVPVSGTGPTVLGASVIAGGVFLLLLGLVF